MNRHQIKSLIAVLIVVAAQIGCGGGGGSSGGPSLSGTFAGEISGGTAIELDLVESGTNVSGTVLFESESYNLTGSLSGDTLNFGAVYKPTSSYCKNISVVSADVLNNKTRISGRMIFRAQNCNGTGVVTGGTVSFSVDKQP